MRPVEIDLHTLPIPDWDLVCPECGYPLRGLPSHRCPECGLTFEMRSVVKSWTRLGDPRFTGDELPLPDFGLLCADCGHPLAGAQSHVCPNCDAPFGPHDWVPRAEWFDAGAAPGARIPMLAIENILATEHIPYVIREGRDPFGLDFRRLRVSSEFAFEFLWLIQKEAKRFEGCRDDGEEQDWVCNRCGSKNPSIFEICWNCAAPHGVSSA